MDGIASTGHGRSRGEGTSSRITPGCIQCGTSENGHRARLSNTSRNPTEEEEGFNSPEIDLRDTEPPLDNCFAFSPTQMHKLLISRTALALDAIGGLEGLARGLRTDPKAGLSSDETSLDGTITFDEATSAPGDASVGPYLSSRTSSPTPSCSVTGAEQFHDRRRVFGSNRLPCKRHKSFIRLMGVAFNDKLLILLTISAAISLAIGIYQSTSDDASQSRVEWINGFSVVVAIIAIVVASAATDWEKNRKFEKLNQRKEQRNVTVIRSGRARLIPAHDLVVGDVVHIEAGDILAVDGVLIEATSLQVDESSVSGESGPVHKTAPSIAHHAPSGRHNPFLWSGTLVTRGVGRYLATAVGANSSHGRTFLSLRDTVQETPLQEKLGRLGRQLITFGTLAGMIFFLILFVRFLINIQQVSGLRSASKAEAFFHILILSIAVVIITVPEGLALNVMVALAFATKRMLKDNNLVRLIRSCEVMGNATCVCSDKTGTLTQNIMTVVSGRIGLDRCFNDAVPLKPGDSGSRPTTSSSNLPESSQALMASLSSDAKVLLRDSVALNSTAFQSSRSLASGFFGSSTETALLNFGRDHLALQSLNEARANNPVLAMLPFDPSRKWMGSLIRLPQGRYRLLVKGAAEIIFEYCAYVLADPTYELPTVRLSQQDRLSFQSTIKDYARNMLRPVAIAFRDFNESELLVSSTEDLNDLNLEWLASGLTIAAILGIRDPLRAGVVNSVRQCQDAGVFARMVTGDNFLTAKTVASECGIYTAGGIAMDGPTFRKLSEVQLDLVVPRLQVLARSSPEDKLLLVTHLKRMGETVAVTGDGTNDSLALKAADVGFAMGIQGTEVAKEAASIILLDDNFASIVKAVSWGRTVIDAAKKFCQFEFTINITASTIAIVSELAAGSIFSVVQLLWINLMMDIFASLGFATDHPTQDFLKRRPEPRNAPIINISMWKMILGQSIYQLTVVFTIYYVRWDVFDPDPNLKSQRLQSFVFNIYVWMQLMNQHNCRRIDNKIDIWYPGVLRNPWFIGVQCITMAGQFIIIFLGGQAFNTHPLTGAQWGWSILFGVLTIPIGALIRQIPDDAVRYLFHLINIPLSALARASRRCIEGLRRNSTPDISESTTQTATRKSSVATNPMRYVNKAWRKLAGTSDISNTIIATERSGNSHGRETHESSNVDSTNSSIDLVELIRSARRGEEMEGNTIEVHFLTQENDPILIQPFKDGVPPSQDARIQQYVAKGYNSVPRGHRRMRGQTQPGTLAMDNLLRSKRR